MEAIYDIRMEWAYENMYLIIIIGIVIVFIIICS